MTPTDRTKLMKRAPSLLALTALTACLILPALPAAAADQPPSDIDVVSPLVADETAAETAVAGGALVSDGKAADVSVDVRSGTDATVSTTSPDGHDLSFSVTPVAAKDGASTQDGMVSYDNVGGKSSTVVQPLEDGVRLMTIIDSASSPTEYAFTFDSDRPVTPVFNDDGSVILEDGNQEVPSVQAPWATDANGKSVPTHYVWRDNTLVQVIDHTNGKYAYPIVADPAWNYLFDILSLSPAGVANVNVNEVTAWAELHRCFNCSFPIGNAPAKFPTDGQIINLNASPFSFIKIAAPVKTQLDATYGWTFIAQPGHFDGAGSTVTFRLFHTCVAGTVPELHLSVRAWVQVDRGTPVNDANKAIAYHQWSTFSGSLGYNAVAHQGQVRSC